MSLFMIFRVAVKALNRNQDAHDADHARHDHRCCGGHYHGGASAAAPSLRSRNRSDPVGLT